jgi:hypothetical protein
LTVGAAMAQCTTPFRLSGKIDKPWARVTNNQWSHCWVPCDHVPVRSWPLFRARQLMRDVIESFKQEKLP